MFKTALSGNTAHHPYPLLLGGGVWYYYYSHAFLALPYNDAWIMPAWPQYQLGRGFTSAI